jgi:hypothetical protein
VTTVVSRRRSRRQFTRENSVTPVPVIGTFVLSFTPYGNKSLFIVSTLIGIPLSPTDENTESKVVAEYGKVTRF